MRSLRCCEFGKVCTRGRSSTHTGWVRSRHVVLLHFAHISDGRCRWGRRHRRRWSRLSTPRCSFNELDFRRESKITKWSNSQSAGLCRHSISSIHGRSMSSLSQRNFCCDAAHVTEAVVHRRRPGSNPNCAFAVGSLDLRDADKPNLCRCRYR